jgi:hypothetical protein
MNAISRSSEIDKKFHVTGALVVAPDKALSHALEQLKRLKDACGSNPVFILSPWPRFVRNPCCDAAGHVSNFSDQDFIQTILRDLTKLRYHLRKTFHPTTVIDSLEIICGNSYSLEKAEQVISGGWALDPVHPTKHIYAKTALNLMEKIANKKDSLSSLQMQNRKRTWSSSNRSEHEGGGGGGGRGGHSGSGSQAGSGKPAKMTERSRRWPEVRRNEGPRSYSDSRYDGGYGGFSGHGGGSGGTGGYHNDNRYSDKRSGDGGYGSRYYGGGGPESGNDRHYRGGDGGGGSGRGGDGRGGGGRGGRGGRGWKAGRGFNPY